MKIEILQGHKFPDAQGVCVVIDVLRAFTTAAFAFSAGAKEIIFVSTPEEAFEKFRQDPTLLLMGEREGVKIDGFHFENSPSQFHNTSLSGKRMVQRTSSGTQGVIGCRHASHILFSSFVVAEATLKRIFAINPTHVTFIATGRTNGEEDLALADYLKAKLLGKKVDLEPLLSRVLNSHCAKRMTNGPISYANGFYDLELATKVDHFPFAMEVFKENGELIGRPVI